MTRSSTRRHLAPGVAPGTASTTRQRKRARPAALVTIASLLAASLLADVLITSACSTSDDDGTPSSTGADLDRGRTRDTGLSDGGPSDTDDGGAADAGSSDSAGDVLVDTDTVVPFECADLRPSDNPGAECGTNASRCGDGVCASFDDAAAQCYDPCVPGECEALCTGGATCRLVRDDAGQPRTFPDGTPQGACVGAPVVGEYGLCSDETGECQDGFLCVSDPRAVTPIGGTCLAICDNPGESCAAYLGYAQECDLTLTNSSGEVVAFACAIFCESAADCPAGLVCAPVDDRDICLQDTL